MVTSDVTSDSSGHITIAITPSLVSAVGVDETITTNDDPFRVHLANDVQEFQHATDRTLELEIDVEEVI